MVPIVVLLLAGTAVFFWTASIRESQQSLPDGFSFATPSATGKESDGSLGQAPEGGHQLPMEGKLAAANKVVANLKSGEVTYPATQDVYEFAGAFARVGYTMTENSQFTAWFANENAYYMPFTDMTGSGWSADASQTVWNRKSDLSRYFPDPGNKAKPTVIATTSTVVGIWADKELYDLQVNLKIGEDTEGGAGTHLVRVAIENTNVHFDGRTETYSKTLEMVVACDPWAGTQAGCRGFIKEELSPKSYSAKNPGFWVFVNTDRYPQPTPIVAPTVE